MGRGRGVKRIAAGTALVLLDLCAYVVSLTLAYLLRQYLLPVFMPGKLVAVFPLTHYLTVTWWYPAIIVMIFAFRGLYTRRLLFWDELKQIMISLTIAFIMFQTIIALGKLTPVVSRSINFIGILIAFLLFPLIRFWGKRMLIHMRVWNKGVLLVGCPENINRIFPIWDREKTLGFEVIGILNPDGRREGQPLTARPGIPVWNGLDKLETLLVDKRIDSMILFGTALEPGKLEHLVRRFQQRLDELYIIPDLKGIPVMNAELNQFFPEAIFLLKLKNSLRSPFNRGLKRIFDLAVTLLLIIPFTLLIILFCIIILADTRAFPLYIDRRLGRNGKLISVIKLRSMHKNADALLAQFLDAHPEKQTEWKKYKKIKEGDPRITRSGGVLRKLSLDELPQIYNVLIGSMSLVGPRPYLPKETDDMAEYIESIHSVTPGITGLWQISGRNELLFTERLELDDLYVKNWSLWLDFIILIKTASVVFRSEGSY